MSPWNRGEQVPMQTNPQKPDSSNRATPRLSRAQRVLLWLVAAIVLFLVGRHFSYGSVDFIVYQQAAKSLIAGRTDLYSDTFAWGPLMKYVYPPLFLLLIFPLGWLSFANAFGIWFAVLALATLALIRRAYGEWQPIQARKFAWRVTTLAGPFLVYSLRGGNAHILVVLITLGGVLAWSQGKRWTTSFAFALAGAIKVFPLFVFPFFVLRREWTLTLRLIGFSCLLWLLPVLYFGPRQTVVLYRQWYETVASDVAGFKRVRQLDHSLTGATERWLTRVDYSKRLDRDYPQANFVELSARTAHAVAWTLSGIALAVSLLVGARLREPTTEASAGAAPNRHPRVAAAASLFITTQLLLGPYTKLLYLSGWLLTALTLPAVFQYCDERMNRLLLVVGIVSLGLFLVPGRASHRAVEAYGAFTLVGICLWVMSLWAAWILRPGAPAGQAARG